MEYWDGNKNSEVIQPAGDYCNLLSILPCLVLLDIKLYFNHTYTCEDPVKIIYDNVRIRLLIANYIRPINFI